MKPIMEYFEYLGLYYGERKLNTLLAALNISAPPILPRGDTDTYLSNEITGIELTLSDSESVNNPQREYPDGALVLVNIRFYGKNMDGFSVYHGRLPYAIKFGLTKSEVITLLGEPEWKNPEESRLRWVRGNHRIHVTLSKTQGAIIVSVGLPL